MLDEWELADMDARVFDEAAAELAFRWRDPRLDSDLVEPCDTVDDD